MYDVGFSVPFLGYGKAWLDEVADALRLNEVEFIFLLSWTITPCWPMTLAGILAVAAEGSLSATLRQNVAAGSTTS